MDILSFAISSLKLALTRKNCGPHHFFLSYLFLPVSYSWCNFFKFLYFCSNHFHNKHQLNTTTTTIGTYRYWATELPELAMDAKSFEGKHNSKDKTVVDDDFEYETEEEEVGGGGGGSNSNACNALGYFDNEKRKRGAAVSGRGKSGGSVSSPSCQAHNCAADLSEAKRYHRRHKVCEFHSKAAIVMVAGIRQRFCQQCSRY